MESNGFAATMTETNRKCCLNCQNRTEGNDGKNGCILNPGMRVNRRMHCEEWRSDDLKDDSSATNLKDYITMTDQQRKGIEILNNLKAERRGDNTPVLSDDDYFFLLSFIVDKQQEVVYVPQIQPQTFPTFPLGPFYEKHWEVTGKLSGDRP